LVYSDISSLLAVTTTIFRQLFFSPRSFSLAHFTGSIFSLAGEFKTLQKKLIASSLIKLYLDILEI
jgi:hypothetical protein